MRPSYAVTAAAFLLVGAAALFAQQPKVQQQRPGPKQSGLEPRPEPEITHGQLDGNVSLFTVLTALNAAGYDAGLDSPSANPIRKKIRDYIAAKNLPSVGELKRFYQDHPNLGFSQYVSYALVLQGPPKFEFVTNMKELPPDAMTIAALSQILERFWEEAGLEKLWRQVQPAYDQLIAQYNEPVSQEILRANAYLRNPTSGYLGRRFQIYLDFMGAPNQLESRSYGDDYFVVISSTPRIPIDDIRHAYLFYVLDPLSLKYSNNIALKRDLNRYAQAAPALDEWFKLDYYLLTTACLVKAVETRLSGLPPAQKAAKIDQALKEGYILTPYFYESLPAYEKQEKSMRLYYPDMIAGIDMKTENDRLAAVKWSEKPAPKVIRAAVDPVPTTALHGPAKTLDEADNLYWQKQYEQARDKYSAVLKETDSTPYHAKAYYGLARIAAVNKEFELSVKLFEKTLELSPETETRSWALVYLGRLSYTGCDPQTAIEYYKKVLAMTGAPASARKAAEEGMADASKDSNKEKCK
jgi:tetratricopeptide (TPR) repeat protein